MKKSMICAIMIIVFFVIPNTLNAEVSTYKVYVINNLNEKTEEIIYNNYNDALTKMNSYDKDIDNVAVIEKDGTLINARYAVAKLKNGGLVYLYDNSSLTSPSYTYIDGNYGVDAAFIDFNDANNTVKIKISGYTGWTRLDNIQIVPISTISTQYISINVSDAYLRTEASLSAPIIKILQLNGPYIWEKKEVIDGVTWYYVNENNSVGWVNNDLENKRITEEKKPNINTFYASTDNDKAKGIFDLWHFYAYRGDNKEKFRWNNLGLAPSILTRYKYYYSFDGNYFYTDYLTMIDDYKSNTYINSINPSNPYYNYYLYLPTHSKTAYTANDFNKIVENAKLTIKPNPETNYVINKTNWVSEYVNSDGSFIKGVSLTGVSQMVNEGSSFIESQEMYGINALLTFGVAINESDTGRSAIALAFNNLFGHGAVDSDSFGKAIAYTSVKESILAHARDYSSKYSDSSDSRYFGSHYGNKGSGMNIKYASDPYWGEKAAANSYNRDLNFGGLDYMSNTIGVKVKDTVIPIKKGPSDESDTIYSIRNKNFTISNVPFVVLDKVIDKNNIGWYKVYSEISLDKDQNITTSPYLFSNSYGYIKEDNLYVSNSQPTIVANDITLEQGIPYDFLKNVSASDKEDGDLTSKIKYTNIQINNDGVFDLTYTVTDSMNFSVSKTVKVTIYASNKPVITSSNREVLQNTLFDPLSGVSVDDPNEGNITSKVKYNSNVDITKVGVYKVMYTVTNNMNITVSKEITVTVLSNALPVIRATDIYMNVNDSLTYLENVSARDLEDGILTSKIKVTHNVDKTKEGIYNVTYEVKDSNNNIINKSIKVYVSNKKYTNLKGELYFNSLNYNSETNLLDISGSLAIMGIDNTKDTDIKYELILKNNITDYEVVLPIERYLDNHPTTVYGDSTHKYTETWFKGSVSLKGIIKGEYTLYVRARSGNYESKVIFNNLFLKNMTKKATDNDGRGYLFRNNNYIKEFPIELFIYENGLISTTEAPSTANMFNTYSSLVLKDKFLKISGNSFNINGDYSKDSSVNRYMILEDMSTEKRYEYNIGSVVGEELILRTNDGLSKVKSWYDTKENIDISGLPVGRYIIYLRTSTNKVDDFGELQDIFLKVTESVIIGDKKYSLSVNKNNRFRVELLVE